MPQEPTNPIRVFLVEDHEGGLEALGALLARTPEGDLLYVGGHTRNTPDLPELVRQAQADVVLVDLALAPAMPPETAERQSETWGIAAIRELRQQCASALKLVAYSNWSQWQKNALTAGANAFLSKGATADELRKMIRHVMGRTSAPPDRMDLGTIIGLELFCSMREYILHGERSTDPIRLQPVPFAFLLYLAFEALERRQEQQAGPHWVEREPVLPRHPITYSMRQPDLWDRITRDYDVGAVYREKPIDSIVIAGWATKINEPLRRFNTHAIQATLIQTPQYDRTGYYALRSSITHIEVHD